MSGEAGMGGATGTTSGGDDAWAPLAERFVDGHYRSLRGRVRTHVIHHQLCEHLSPPPGEVVDVGGGAGHQSLPLARLGYAVTIVDPSPAMLERAARRLAGEPPEVARRVQLVEAAGEEAPGLLGGSRFAGVLCHGVLMYLDDPAPLVGVLAALAAPGAVVSIAAKNRASLAVRPALAGDWKAALAAFDAERQVNGLGVDTRADTVEGLRELLAGLGVEPIAWYGVRLFTDGWRPELPAAVLEGPEGSDLLAVELEAGRRDPYRQLSRLFHLVGRRSGATPKPQLQEAAGARRRTSGS